MTETDRQRKLTNRTELNSKHVKIAKPSAAILLGIKYDYFFSFFIFNLYISGEIKLKSIRYVF